MDRSPRPSRQRRLDYCLLNDGSDEEASFEDRIHELPMAPILSSIISEDSCTIQPRNRAARATEGPKARGSQTVIFVASISMSRLVSDVIGRLQIRQGKLQLQTWQDIWNSIQSTLPNLALELQAQRNSLLSLPFSKGNRFLQSSNFSKGTFTLDSYGETSIYDY
ncbi:hypothetical protein POJ06DRAFT_284469 [Lipomyces tetrasporus]|uniref:Uncharacterized protein n=1 Tax=Lipomyces tetrasporus TaxID=54092 RepID=A0AAD7QY62_9ASCO|nr:uncharacterized protein POJ06DRAFT_284469 [Lipomyces tetrasporus]KAJ8103617.1 hypothetical protein POJ06DRAFT_284469 [Lipomyces tetrasporus]